MSMKNPNEKIGNRTRDLPVCSVMSQPTALPLGKKRCRWDKIEIDFKGVRWGGREMDSSGLG